MAWHTKYHNRGDFLASFLSEQEYIDAMFIYLIMANFGVWLDMDSLLREDA